jgi:Copper type II ascorbate-dependent monooxygenase, C-terminal domain
MPLSFCRSNSSKYLYMKNILFKYRFRYFCKYFDNQLWEMKNLSHSRGFFFVTTVAAVALLIYACDPNSEDQRESSFGLIQTKILNTSCAISGCHASGADNSFPQHRLVLEKKVAYKNLVGAAPANANALTDNLLRVKPFLPDESLLFHKLHLFSGHHTRDYGNPMPLGLPALSEGQLEFVRLWIEAGASEKGMVADAALLDDASPQQEDFEPLPAPEPGKGLQIVIPTFSVVPNFEREFFVYKKLGNDQPIFVDRFEIKMRQNSHHFILYDFNAYLPEFLRPAEGVVRDIRNPDGSLNIGNVLAMPYHVFIMGTQAPYLDYHFPEGVAVAFAAGALADFNSHYVNKQATEIPGEVYVNLHTVDAANVVKLAKAINLPNQNIILPANQRTTVTKAFQFDYPLSVISITSHTHKLAEKFMVKINGGTRHGETVYTNLDWKHPGFVTFTPPIALQAGEGLTSVITYNNTTSKTVSFGLTSEDEMGIIFGYYYEE